jgi:hypothetical protein
MLRLIAVALIAAVTLAAVPADARARSRTKSSKKVMVHRKAHPRH